MALKTNVYIDGFNLYYGSVRGTDHAWLDMAAFCARLLPNNQVNRIRYFTALVTPRPSDPQQRNRQEIYIRALRTIPNLTIYFGSSSDEAPHETRRRTWNNSGINPKKRART